MKRTFSMILTLLVTLLISTTALAMTMPGLSSNKYIKTYGLSSANDTPVYRDSRLSVRGTTQRAYNATIYATDEIYIYAMNDTFAYISYPTGNTRSTGYIRTSTITGNNFSKNPLRSRSAISRVYKRPGVIWSGSSISNGDNIWTLARNGNYTQVIYPAGNLYKMGWISNSDYDNYIAERNTPTEQYAYPNEGDYFIIPESDSSYAIDVKGGGQAAEGTPLWIYQKNNTDAQIFTLKRVSDEWYMFIHKRTGYVINVQGGNQNNDARLWLYRNDGTASCHWRFINAGNGSYIIQSRLDSHRVFDLHNNQPYNGAIFHMWDRHSGQSAKWKLVSASAQTDNDKKETKQTVYAYNDSSLTNKIGQVDKGDKVTILQQSGNVYKVRYPVTKTGGTKDGWVSADIFKDPPPVPAKLQELINKWNGQVWSDGYSRSQAAKNAGEYVYSSSKQCKEFASYIFNILYKIGYIGSGSSEDEYYNWKLTGRPARVDTRGEVSPRLNIDQVKQLFQNAQPGDFIQMKRAYKNKNGNYGPHSAILVERNSTGVIFFEANAPDKNGNYVYDKINVTNYTYERLIEMNQAMSIYYAK